MIKEFWQERKEEKRRQKEQKKAEKKTKSGEQLYYKICGIILAIIVIVGPFACSIGGGGDLDGYEWENVLGITDEMKEKLSAPIDKSVLVTTRALNSADELELEQTLKDVGLESLISSNEDVDDNANFALTEELVLKSNLVGVLANEFLEVTSYSGEIFVIELIIYEDDDKTMLKSLMQVNLSKVIAGANLPYVYITTISRIKTLDGTLASIGGELVINDFDKEFNNEVLKVLDTASLVGMSKYTNDLIVQQINMFATLVDAKIDLTTINMKFVSK